MLLDNHLWCWKVQEDETVFCQKEGGATLAVRVWSDQFCGSYWQLERTGRQSPTGHREFDKESLLFVISDLEKEADIDRAAIGIQAR